MSCEEGIYTANRHNYAQLTNAHRWNSAAGTWSGNLIGGALPFPLLPNPVLAGDLVVFGIDSAVINAGPFHSLVFDIATAITGVTTTVWRWSDAGADPTIWTRFGMGLSIETLDNTNQNGLCSGVAFDTTGIRSVHWETGPGAWAWQVQDPQVGINPALGITGYWVCLHVTAAAGATPPVQQNRDIYTVLWPYIEIGADDLGGDLPAIPRILLKNQSDGSGLLNPLFNGPQLWQNKVIVGSRSLTRKQIDCSDFSAFMNCSSQNALGVHCSTARVADLNSATGEAVQVTGNGGGAVSFAIDSAYSPQYYGRYHAYVLAMQETDNIGDVTVALRWYSTSVAWGYRETQYVPFSGTVGTHHSVIDLGEVTLGAPGALLGTELTDMFLIVRYQVALAAQPATITFYTLVLMPIDEWAGEYRSPAPGSITAYAGGIGSRGDPQTNFLQQLRYLMIDGYGIPKTAIRAPMFRDDNDTVINLWESYGPSPVLTPNTAQRLWLLTSQYEQIASVAHYSRPECVMSIELSVQQRYSSMRGDR